MARTYKRGEIRLMMSAEIRERLGGISRQRVYAITSRKGFPDPLVTLAAGNVWLADEVEVWMRDHRPELEDGA